MKKNVKIAIDISPLNDGNITRGVGHYTQHLVSAIQKEVKTNPKYVNYQIDLIKNSKLEIKNYDLVHYPYFDPFFLTLPPQNKTPFLATVHDLIPRQFKTHFPVGIKGEIKWLIQKHRLRQAKYIITVSHFSKYIINDLIEYPKDKIFVTYEAADDNFKPRTDKNLLSEIKAKYNLPDEFVLYVGDLNWSKNIPKLIDVCLNLKIPLVLVGSAATRKNVVDHPWNKDILWVQSIAPSLQSSKALTLTGFVPDGDLPLIFNLATIYCQPSYAEGFGLPLVQAMKSGCPVAYSQESSIPEIMDYNGVFFDPYSQKSMEKAIGSLWKSRKLRQKYAQLGRKRAEIFDWSYTAIQTLSVYELALIDQNG
ncbi:MAG: glycosyltransferase family 1 protein [Candidatus Shapirobacteria bacterium]|jgi:glycosyltransferase involved in cell wall biosynthesis